jgi:hypothetical protein
MRPVATRDRGYRVAAVVDQPENGQLFEKPPRLMIYRKRATLDPQGFVLRRNANGVFGEKSCDTSAIFRTELVENESRQRVIGLSVVRFSCGACHVISLGLHPVLRLGGLYGPHS